MKSKLICSENEPSKEKKVLIFNLEINMLVYEIKIKFIIKEIQENLKNNPSLYEANFNYEDLAQKRVHFKNLQNLESIFTFLDDLFNDSKDSIKKENNKIIINVKFTLGSKETEVSFELTEKNVSLETSLKHFNQTLKEINKNNIVTNSDLKNMKLDFKRDLLEKVYPIGSYYWSSKDTSPSEIFGGSWTRISGRFLFVSDSNHYVGETGGEERHTLTINEIPAHSHSYERFHYDETHTCPDKNDGSSYYPYANKDYDYYRINSSRSSGGGNSHNNMPPYLAANCWKRTG